MRGFLILLFLFLILSIYFFVVSYKKKKKKIKEETNFTVGTQQSSQQICHHAKWSVENLVWHLNSSFVGAEWKQTQKITTIPAQELVDLTTENQ